MLAGRLQRGTTTLATRMEDTVRVRLGLPSAPGSDAALCRGLRASSRRYHRPTWQIQQPERTQDWTKLGGKVTAILRRTPYSVLHPEVGFVSRDRSNREDHAAIRRRKCQFTA